MQRIATHTAWLSVSLMKICNVNRRTHEARGKRQEARYRAFWMFQINCWSNTGHWVRQCCCTEYQHSCNAPALCLPPHHNCVFGTTALNYTCVILVLYFICTSTFLLVKSNWQQHIIMFFKFICKLAHLHTQILPRLFAQWSLTVLSQAQLAWHTQPPWCSFSP